MRFNAESILKIFKETQVADAPTLKHTQYLNYLAQRLGYQNYERFKRCLNTAPSDRIGDFYTTLIKKICAIRKPADGIAHVRFSHFDGKSIGYDSYFIVGTNGEMRFACLIRAMKTNHHGFPHHPRRATLCD